tara:strand:+ start:1229 stop:1774 length:546 start_codon:yes stop_codon:yes gene_type:complete
MSIYLSKKYMKNHEYAGFWIRVGANLIDLIIVVILYGIFSALLMFAFGDLFISNIYYEGGRMNYRPGFIFFNFWDAFFQYFLPFIATIWFWLKFQATPGKMATSLKLVDAKTGNTITTGQSIGRYFAQILSLIPFGLGYFWIAFDRKNQSWHDKLAGTVVIRNRHVEKVVFEKPKKESEEL